MYCGASVIVREAIQTAAVASVPNLLRLANTAALSGNYHEAYNYFTKVLEYDSHNSEAWAGKAEAAGWQSCPNGFRIPEMINYFSNAIEGASEEAKENVKSRATLSICKITTHYYKGMRTALSPAFADGTTWTTYLNKIGDLIKCIDQANNLLPESKDVLVLGNYLIDDNSRPIPYLLSGKRYARYLPANWQSFLDQRRSVYSEKLWVLDPSLRPATPVRSSGISDAYVYWLVIGGVVLVLFLVVLMIVAMSNNTERRSFSPNKVEQLPPEVHVKRYANTIDVEHEKIRIYPANIKLAKSSMLNEWFELEHTASCSNNGSTPKAVVMTLMHETPSKSGWHFPSATSTKLIEPNAGFTVTLKLQSGDAVFNKAHQLDLRKDSASDPTFYETFIADVSLDTLKKFGDQPGAVIYELPGAQLTLTPKQSATLYAFAHAALRCGRE